MILEKYPPAQILGTFRRRMNARVKGKENISPQSMARISWKNTLRLLKLLRKDKGIRVPKA